MNSFIKTEDHVTVVFEDGETGTCYNTDPKYGRLCEAVKKGDYEDARDVLFPGEGLQRKLDAYQASFGKVKVEHGVVSYMDKPLHNTLTERMLDMISEGWDIAPLARFLNNLQDNPSYRAVNELYGFLENSDLPITDDGYFLAYKRIRGDFKDIYSGTMDNSVGTVVKMPRNEVNEDANQTCSAGLHFCSRSYLNSYGTSEGNTTVVLKINPRDVVSIPTDYNNAKGRACEYLVLRELEHKNEEKLEGSYAPDVTDDYDNDDDNGFDPIDWDDDGDVIEQTREVVRNSLGNHRVSNPYDPNSDAVFIVGATPHSGKFFATANEAANFAGNGATASNIRAVCRGERKTCGGYEWAWSSRSK